MNLFDQHLQFPEGFAYMPDFISEDEEQKLLQIISGIDLHTFTFQGYEAKRKVASFGYDYDFDQRALLPGRAIPDVFDPLIQKVADYLHLATTAFAELLITEYPIGAVINWHRDAAPFELIAGISLQADCLFRLRPHQEVKRSRHTVISLPVRRRSLYIMKGPARSDWQHSTAPVKKTRYSITLRTLKG
ncbi:MAG TPA: alpha-ketoglutarate-dependent dioxygenase AlkB [Cytophagales bacterium]|nr:alpha-ketoglutarate-dependent dioxygenase AlkB [Cytophagales bacterium]